MSDITATLASQPWWMVLIMVLMSMLVLVMGAVTWTYDLRSARLPQATRWDDLSHKLVSLGGQIADKQVELQEILRRIQDRDRIAAEVAALTEKLETLRLEISALGDAEIQIEEMKRKAADVAGDYALAVGNLERAQAELTTTQQQKAKLEQEIEALRHKLDLIPELHQELEREIGRLKIEKSTLADELATLRGARGQLLAAREEVAALATRKGAIEQEIDALRARLDAMPGTHDTLQKDIEALGTELAALRNERSRLLDARDDAAALSAHNALLRQECDALEARIADIRGNAVFAEYERKRDENEQELGRMRADLAHAMQLVSQVGELAARKAALEEDIGRIRGEFGGGVSPDDDLDDLRQHPLCLPNVASVSRPPQQEHEALYEVGQYLKELDLQYSPRVIRAFHTALKINETSQMTVLAGVSGTGKSLLPRRYAEAMGLHFLQIAVEPRWDSPQDLLGFYNYVEKRYRGTELARALVHMDPYNTSGLAAAPLKDHMLLVLLDEMNLARVEYYFSEFLSRLEVRPRASDVDDEPKRRGASLPIDIRGRKQGPVQLFPSHNVLFAGTMNDDESTQALSDKVLDRGNVMQFAAPADFARPAETQTPSRHPEYRSHAQWRMWIKPTDSLVGGERNKAERGIKALAEIMEACGRPFGHRLNEAILAYVANYPPQAGNLINDALADQIEFRILPKLRGLPIEGHEREFERLGTLIRDELDDAAFADRLRGLTDRQGITSGQFNWRGLDRGKV
jgi:predicted  nucleic acid-binding Zn-ribbon protein